MFNGFGTICADCRRGEAAERRRSTTLEVARMEAMGLFEFIDVDNNQEVTCDEWLQAFDRIDRDGNGAVSRKEWTLKNGTTHMFDSIFKAYSVRVTRDEWRQGFLGLDKDNNGKLSVSEWLRSAPTILQESSTPALGK